MPIGQNPLLFAYILTCCVAMPINASLFGGMRILWCIAQAFLQGVAWAYLVCLITSICRNRALKYAVVGICTIIFTLPTLFDAGTWAALGKSFDEDCIVLVVNTTSTEASGFFAEYFTLKAIGRFILYILVDAAICAAFYFLLRKLRPFRLFASMCIFVGAILIGLYILALANSQAAFRILSHNYTIVWVKDYSDPVTKSLMHWRHLYPLIKGVKEWNELQCRVWQEDDAVEVTGDGSYNVGLILGESMIKKMYCLDTEYAEFIPNMKREYGDGRLVVFSDILAVAKLTHMALRNMANLSDVRDNKFEQGVFFPLLAHKAGWSVNFYSNQTNSPTSQYDLSNIFLSDINRAKVYYQYNDKLFDYDDLWYSYIQQKYYPHEQQHNRLSIYHFKALHFPWSAQYRGSGHFRPGDIKAAESSQWREEVAKYASAMWSNDSIVGQIFEHFNNDGPAVVVYISDHGEMLESEVPEYYSRASNKFDDPQWVKACFEVPMFVWMNQEFIEQNPVLAEQIRAAANRPATSDNLSYAMLHLLGIGGKYYRPELDIFSPDYVPRPRIDIDGHPIESLR